MEKLKYSPRHEQIILGCMLKDKPTRKRLAFSLTSREFYTSRHKLIFTALGSLVSNNLEYTPGTLSTLLPDEEDWGGVEYLEKLEKVATEPENVDHHVAQMKWDLTRVEVFENVLPEMISDLKDPRTDPEDVIRQARTLSTKLGESHQQTFFETGEELQSRYSASIHARKIGVGFRSSGFLPIDKKLVVGFSPGKLSVITGCPSNGKTSLALNMAARQARTFKVGYLAWESGTQDALDCICSAKTKIPIEKLAKLAHMLTDEEQEQIDDYTAELLGNDNLAFMKQPPRALLSGNPWDVNDRVLDWVESQLENWNRDIVYWDLFEKRLPARRPEHISNAIDRVQEMILPNRCNVHMVLLHQMLLKEVERRKDQRPTRDALKGSAAYIEAPDLVLGVYRPAVYEFSVDDNILEVICLKQRKGPWPWKIIFKWRGDITRVSGGHEGPMVVKNEPEDYGSRI